MSQERTYLIIHAYHEEGYHGDRAAFKTSYVRHAVVLVNGSYQMELKEFDPYNNFHQCIGPSRLAEAKKYAAQVAETLGGIPILQHDYKKKVHTTVAWELKEENQK
jgi:hypothetical protein